MLCNKSLDVALEMCVRVCVCARRIRRDRGCSTVSAEGAGVAGCAGGAVGAGACSGGKVRMISEGVSTRMCASASSSPPAVTVTLGARTGALLLAAVTPVTLVTPVTPAATTAPLGTVTSGSGGTLLAVIPTVPALELCARRQTLGTKQTGHWHSVTPLTSRNTHNGTNQQQIQTDIFIHKITRNNLYPWIRCWIPPIRYMKQRALWEVGGPCSDTTKHIMTVAYT